MKKFITVTRVSDIIYWKCPTKTCSQFHEITIDSLLPHTISCEQCMGVHIIKQIVQLTKYSARILIEVKI